MSKDNRPESITAAKIAELDNRISHLATRFDALFTFVSRQENRLNSFDVRLNAAESNRNAGSGDAATLNETLETLRRMTLNQADIMDQLDEISRTVNPLKEISIEPSTGGNKGNPNDPPF